MGHQPYHRGEPTKGISREQPSEALTRRMGELARELATHHGRVGAVQAVVEASLTDIPGTEHASMSITTKARSHTLMTLAASSPLAEHIDQAQNRAQEGPCIDTLYDRVTVRSGDLRTESRWPRFAHLAVDQGVLSVLCVQLFTDGQDLGGLNLFSTRPDAFTDQAERKALAFAAHAAVAVAAAHEIHGLKHALDRRDVIGQAKGVLMERHRISGSVAFAVLVRYSRDNNIELVDVARKIVDDVTQSSPRATSYRLSANPKPLEQES